MEFPNCVVETCRF